MSTPSEQGLLEELLSALLSKAAMLQRVMKGEADPQWTREFDETKRRVAEVQEQLRRFEP